MPTKPFVSFGIAAVVLLLTPMAIIVWAAARLSTMTDPAFKTLTDHIVALAWPIALVLVALSFAVLVERLLPSIMEFISSRQSVDTFLSSDFMHQLEETSESFSGRLTRLITEAYDQYEGPMAPNLVIRLQQKLKREVENGRTDVLRDKRILWLHREPRHDRLESLAFQICGASVRWCFTVDEATNLLKQRKDTFDVIISHMGEHEDAFTLNQNVPKEYAGVPFVVYTRRASDSTFQLRAGELKIERYTNLPDELFELVVDALNAEERTQRTEPVVPIIAPMPELAQDVRDAQKN